MPWGWFARSLIEDGTLRLCTIIILNYNGRELLREGIPSVVTAVEQCGADHEILVVDNGSSDGSVSFLRSAFPQIRVLELEKNYYFGGGNNRGIKAAQHDIVVLLNNDMVVDRDFLTPLLGGFIDDSVFAVASQVFFQDANMRREETGKTNFFWDHGLTYLYHQNIDELDVERGYVPVAWAHGGAAAYDRTKFLALGLFDELFSPCYVEDLDVSYMAWKRGWKSLLCPSSIVYHKHRATSAKQYSPRELDRIVLRNRILFHWKNLSSFRFLLKHLAYLPLHILNRWGKRGNHLPFLEATRTSLQRLGKVLSSRQALPPAIVTDDMLLKDRYIKRSFEYENKRLRILMVCALLPGLRNNAGAIRMYNIIKELNKRHRVDIVTYYEREEEQAQIEELKQVCHRVIAIQRGISPDERDWLHTNPKEVVQEFCNPAMKEALDQELFLNDYDVVQFEYVQMGYLQEKVRKYNSLFVLTNHEVQARRLRREISQLGVLRGLSRLFRLAKMLVFENRTCSRFDAVVALSPEDKEYLQSYNPHLRLLVSPMGVDPGMFSSDSRPTEPFSMMFVGSFRHTPNVDAMLHFCKSILPRLSSRYPDLKLYVVGGDVPDEIKQLRRLGNVVVTGWVEDIRPYYAKSAIVIAPLRLGGGMRGKILEAWAMGKPVVTTSIGAEGLDYDNGSDIIVADGEEEFAHAIERLLDEPLLQKEMGLKGRKRAVKQYTWEAVAAGYEKLYYELLKEK